MMLPLTRTGITAELYGCGVPALVLLHFFGGSQSEWTETVTHLAVEHECITMDLPGFGDAASFPGYSVREMMESVAATILSLKLSSFVLIGHSMSGKVALSLASAGVSGLAGLVLVAPSPPSPEPIEEKNRQKMLGFDRVRADAESYLDGITAHPLTGDVRERAIQDFIRCSRDAWSAWLKQGSKEDLSRQIGMVTCPTLVITGETDASLSASVQQELTLPHLRRGSLKKIADCGHLPMMETPAELASLILQFASRLHSEDTLASTVIAS